VAGNQGFPRYRFRCVSSTMNQEPGGSGPQPITSDSTLEKDRGNPIELLTTTPARVVGLGGIRQASYAPPNHPVRDPEKLRVLVAV
jgi:hypothetical protein